MPRRTASRPLAKGSTFLLPCLTMLGFLLAASPTCLAATGAPPATDGAPGEASSTSSEPVRFLLIPITGLVGVDVKSTGVEEAIQLARSQSWEAVIFEIDSTMGLLDEGLAIAGQIKLASPNLRTIALVRRVGGAGIPVLFACEEWLVIDEFEVEEKVQYAPSVTSVLGTDRTVIQTLPTWGGSADSVSADLAALRTAARRSIPTSSSKTTRAARNALLDALVDPVLDLQLGADGELSTTPRVGGRKKVPENVIAVSDLGPGITAIDLERTNLSSTVAIGLEPLRLALGAETVEPQGDPGVLLIRSDAEEFGNRRAMLGNRIDGLFSALDAIDSLSSSLPWSVERARLVDPTSPRLRDRYPMVHVDGRWELAPDGIKAWNAACDRAIRRWNGVGSTFRELNSLVPHAESLLQKIRELTPIPEDIDRHAAAVRVAEPILASIKGEIPSWDAERVMAAGQIARLERLKSGPPTTSP
ncbi:MAG: hypothetical protein P8J59_04830 [Phycisphaerales bacterium]|jgi:hypothetical protein|nr:hypothetical protein [Phycisphaerales bacterium]